MPASGPGQTDTRDWWEERTESSCYDNFGFHRLDRLLSNIGYLELTGFDYTKLAGETGSITTPVGVYDDGSESSNVRTK